MDPIGWLGSAYNAVQAVRQLIQQVQDNAQEIEALDKLMENVGSVVAGLMEDVTNQHSAWLSDEKLAGLKRAMDNVKARAEDTVALVTWHKKLSKLMRVYHADEFTSRCQAVREGLMTGLHLLNTHTGSNNLHLTQKLQEAMRNVGSAQFQMTKEMKEIQQVLQKVYSQGQDMPAQVAAAVSQGIARALGHAVTADDLEELRREHAQQTEAKEALHLQQLIQALELSATLAESHPRRVHPAVPPASITCPITLDVMRDPAMLVDSGWTFDREAIEQWLSLKLECPVTRKRVTSLDRLIPNYMLRHAIQEWHCLCGSPEVNEAAAASYNGVHTQPAAATHSGVHTQPAAATYSGVNTQAAAATNSGVNTQPAAATYSGVHTQPAAAIHSSVHTQPTNTGAIHLGGLVGLPGHRLGGPVDAGLAGSSVASISAPGHMAASGMNAPAPQPTNKSQLPASPPTLPAHLDLAALSTLLQTKGAFPPNIDLQGRTVTGQLQPGHQLAITQPGTILANGNLNLPPGVALSVQAPDVRLRGLTVSGQGSPVCQGLVIIPAKDATVENCTINVLHSGDENHKCSGIRVHSGGSARAVQCRVSAASASGFISQGRGSHLTAQSCTAVDCIENGFTAQSGGELHAENGCIASNNKVDGFCAQGAGAKLSAGYGCKADSNVETGFSAIDNAVLTAGACCISQQ